ncbi:Gfo/Idh/MocA family protein [Actinoplanes sp. DH11]|uniref:Gfo/Idh/MocA family protein n=1 Tax=Actinoplanes sp. DH11 TaxID=2857011 RepID=UPI001E283BF7|nr:Gfo/Idh/MocA family oxidoreductase [Actinoplanes sp. DH11]
MTPRVALIGAGGHGASHRRTLARLAAEGRLKVAGLCDREPVEAPDAPFFTDHNALLAEVRPDVVIICTPPHTHLPIALDALTAGADLLLEKPPVMSLDEHHRLAAEVAETGRLCQVGFQALGSAALAALIAAGPTGPIGVLGAWWRPDTYYSRAPWAGRRAVGGRPVLDGALVNPFAHALMQALVIAGPGFRPVTLELERYRTRAIETDDTTFLRVTGTDGRRITLAVTLASEVFLAGEIRVGRPPGEAALEYPTDRLRLPGSPFREVPGRAGLLENLLDHRDDPAVELLAPLERTEVFTAVAEAIVRSEPPVEIGGRWLRPHPAGGGQVLPGIDALVRQVAETGELPSEAGVGWAVPARRIGVRLGAYPAT